MTNGVFYVAKRGLQKGTNMATIKDIAQKAGVSIGTVDRVLHNRGMVNEQTKQQILAVIKELDYHPNQAAQGLAVRKRRLKLYFIIPDAKNHPFYSDVRNAAEKKAAELKQYGVQVVFRILKENLSLESLHLYEDLEEMDGLVMLGMQYGELKKYLSEVQKRKIPIVFYNSILENFEYLAYVGCNYVNAGRLAAGLSALAGGEDARVCIYSEGYVEIASYDERLKGFREEVENQYPEMQILDVREISNDQIDNYLSAVDMLKTFPDVNVVYVMNPADYGICEAIARADEKHQIRIITNDLVERQIGMIKKGIISATVCQEPEKQGAEPLEILFRYLAYSTLPEEKKCYTNLSIHIAQNL